MGPPRWRRASARPTRARAGLKFNCQDIVYNQKCQDIVDTACCPEDAWESRRWSVESRPSPGISRWSPGAICSSLGCSRPWFYKWLTRYRDGRRGRVERDAVPTPARQSPAHAGGHERRLSRRARRGGPAGVCRGPSIAWSSRSRAWRCPRCAPSGGCWRGRRWSPAAAGRMSRGGRGIPSSQPPMPARCIKPTSWAPMRCARRGAFTVCTVWMWRRPGVPSSPWGVTRPKTHRCGVGELDAPRHPRLSATGQRVSVLRLTFAPARARARAAFVSERRGRALVHSDWGTLAQWHRRALQRLVAPASRSARRSVRSGPAGGQSGLRGAPQRPNGTALRHTTNTSELRV